MNIIQRLWNYEPAILTAVAAIVTAVKARPVEVSAIVGGVSTIAVAAAAFGLHLSGAEIGALAAILSGILGLVFRANLTPAKARPA